MTLETVENKSKTASWMFLLIIIFFIIGAVIFSRNEFGTFEEHNALQDLDGLSYAIQSLIVGNASGFVEGLVQAMPVIGLFIVLFAIMHFLFVKLFKLKYATVLALVLSIYPFIDQRVYNYMLSLNAFTIAFVVFLAMVIMIWGLSSHSNKRLQEERRLLKQITQNPKVQEDKENVRRIKHMLKEMG